MPESITVAQPSSPHTVLEVSRSFVATSDGPSIAQIFKPVTTRFEVRPNGRRHQFPWYLGQICSTWRAVFLSMHCEFWSQFCLSPDPSVPSDIGQEVQMRCIDIAKLFLERGQGKPFSFKLQTGVRSSRLLGVFIEEPER